jgi:hypothetical protein
MTPKETIGRSPVDGQERNRSAVSFACLANALGISTGPGHHFHC